MQYKTGSDRSQFFFFLLSKRKYMSIKLVTGIIPSVIAID